MCGTARCNHHCVNTDIRHVKTNRAHGNERIPGQARALQPHHDRGTRGSSVRKWCSQVPQTARGPVRVFWRALIISTKDMTAVCDDMWVSKTGIAKLATSLLPLRLPRLLRLLLHATYYQLFAASCCCQLPHATTDQYLLTHTGTNQCMIDYHVQVFLLHTTELPPYYERTNYQTSYYNNNSHHHLLL